jgi:hypothetical protein
MKQQPSSGEISPPNKGVESLRALIHLLGEHCSNHEIDMPDDEDEILVTLAEQLANFTELIGGHANILILVKPLEILACAEETIIRDKVLDNINILGHRKLEESLRRC